MIAVILAFVGLYLVIFGIIHIHYLYKSLTRLFSFSITP